MAIFDRIGDFFSFGKKDNMAQAKDFVPTDIIKSRYPDPRTLIKYLKTLPDGFTDDKITVKDLGERGLGLRLPRPLQQEEREGAMRALEKAESERQKDEED